VRTGAPSAAIAVRADDAPVPAKREEDAADVRRLTIDVPKGARRIDVAAPSYRPFTLGVLPARKIAWLDEARALRGKGDLARARAIASSHEADADAVERALAKGMLARLALAEGKADAAFPLFREAIALHRDAGRISDLADDSFALAFALHQRSHRYGEARAALDAIAGDLPLYPEGRAREPYYRGILASETGDRRGALGLLRAAESRAHALGMGRLERNARAALALEMQALGRARASMEILRALEKDPAASPCERVEVAVDLGWGALLANESAGAPVEDARGPLERAIGVEGCTDAYLRSFALANLARVALDDGDAAEAARRLEAARAAVKEPRGTERIAWLDLEGRILLAQKKPREALARFDEARALARAAVLLDQEWSATTSRAEALEALGRADDAIAALRDAEDILDRAMLLVPLGEGREGFVADRSRSARAAIDVLVRAKKIAEAAAVAKRSRARVLAGVERALRIERLSPEERARWEAAVRAYRAARESIDADAAQDWKLASDALARTAAARKERERELESALEAAMAVLARDRAPAPAPAPIGARDLDLVIHPGRGGWHVFALDATSATAHAVPRPSAAADEELARALFDPLATRIDRAARVRVHAYGAWRFVDVHALSFRGAPLAAAVAVDYPLGLGPRSEPSRDAPRALIVGDPRSDLPHAREEAESVARAIGARLATTALVADRATSRAVRDALPRAEILHYAGHGVFAGLEGWESALPLADNGSLTVGDVLALAPVPRKVVLSGCEAARAEGEAEGLGLAQGFVVAGAEEAIAPTRPVSDELAAALAAALWADAGAAADLGRADALARAMHDATKRLVRERASLDWAAFRVLAR
jgi:tetratricopeptide (TPR) repeat protein